jgi:hypothetical protein
MLSQQQDIEFDEEVVRAMTARHYCAASRPMSACHPRDIPENLMDRARLLKIKPSLTTQLLDHACQSYFVKLKRGDRLEQRPGRRAPGVDLGSGFWDKPDPGT